ncbi:uncharacterized protein EAF02_009492 [Botrytis sinoallii]|uniref:uncharacterized protein n=1 Tax=Botrytis sinoallii TaxID=1463999 RepID=UPI001901AB63|nr:uncharacterized protein EAF02_009492 [Botrytis sinoallii]KAF7868756.1 hypothetical protein EAF02_009492 [Botrytis sinoallii]
MPKTRGPKSNANRRNRATRRTDRLAHVPPHTMIKYAASPADLSIDLDFCTPRSVAGEKEIFDELLEIIPQYADETNIIQLRIVFSNALKRYRGSQPSRHSRSCRRNYHGFPHIKEIPFLLISITMTGNKSALRPQSTASSSLVGLSI